MSEPANDPKPRLKRKPARCPKCRSHPLASILHGMPVFSPKLDEELQAGWITLGGCCITDDDPAWECSNCGWQGWRSDGVT